MPETGQIAVLRQRIQGRAKPREAKPPVITRQACWEISQELSLPLRQVEVAALEEGVIPSAYTSNLFGLSMREVLLLRRSRVCQIGLGGLGGYLLEILARVGVGEIKAADGDRFEEGNLNRQILSSEPDLGSCKAEVANRRVRQINSAVEFTGLAYELDQEGFREAVAGSDLAIDALGGLPPRRELREAAVKKGVTLVSGAIAGEAGYVITLYPRDPDPEDLWSGETGAEGELGCLPHAVAAVASLQAAEVVHLLCGRGPGLRGRMGVWDLSDFSWQILSFA